VIAAVRDCHLDLGRKDPHEDLHRRLSSRPTPRDPAERETEGEWRDPEDIAVTMLIQGVLPRLFWLQPLQVSGHEFIRAVTHYKSPALAAAGTGPKGHR
jgi:hypothetical protein